MKLGRSTAAVLVGGFLLVAVTAWAQRGPGWGMRGAGSGGNCAAQIDSLPKQALDAAESKGLLYLREEEKLARDVYAQLYAVSGSQVFARISQSEQRHFDTVTKKMVPQIVRLYNQMPEPKYVVAMGACASGGGPFKEGYNVVSGVDQYVPVDVYITGCPPTPQALLHGLITLQRKIDAQSIKQARWYSKEPIEALPVPILGPDLMTPKQFEQIKAYAQQKLLEGQVPADASAVEIA